MKMEHTKENHECKQTVFMCKICDCEILKKHRTRHNKTKKHQRNEEQKIQQEKLKAEYTQDLEKYKETMTAFLEEIMTMNSDLFERYTCAYGFEDNMGIIRISDCNMLRKERQLNEMKFAS